MVYIWTLCKAGTVLEDSLKNTGRVKCGRGINRHVVAEGATPNNWWDFIYVDNNKKKRSCNSLVCLKSCMMLSLKENNFDCPLAEFIFEQV